MSASLMSPVAGSKKTRVRPGRSLPLKSAAFSGVLAIVIRLTPSPPVLGLIDCVVEEVSTKRMSDAPAHCSSARRAAPVTSLPALIFAAGDASELDSAIVTTLLGHLMWTAD